jgi:hypothetical protein
MKGMKQAQQKVLIGVAAVILAVSGLGAWWLHARQNPNRIFWDMLGNNLSTTGYTHSIQQQSQGLSVSQYTQMNFTAHPTARALTTFKSGNNVLTTEEISNAQQDLVRYRQIQIKSGKTPKNVQNVLGKWARLQKTESLTTGQVTSGLFKQSLLDVLPIANLTPAQRQKLLGMMRSQKVFSYVADDVHTQTINGRKAYVYALDVNQAGYVRVMRQFEAWIGATNYQGLKPSDFAKAQPVSVVVAVDVRSHTLAQLYQASSGRVQTYSGFGIAHDTKLPKATITTQQLTQKLASLQQ